MFTNTEIGNRIHDTRIARRLTLGDIALHIGVAESTIQRYEKGSISKIKLPVIESIAAALDVNPNWLIGNVDDPAPLHRLPAPQMVLSSDEKDLVGCYRSMNPEGQTAALAAVRGLASSGLYKKRDNPPDLLDLG